MASKEVEKEAIKPDEVDNQEPFEPVDEIQEPFAQFTSLGARRISDSVEFDDFVRVFKFFHRVDYGVSDAHAVSASDSRNGVTATAGVLSVNPDATRFER